MLVQSLSRVEVILPHLDVFLPWSEVSVELRRYGHLATGGSASFLTLLRLRCELSGLESSDLLPQQEVGVVQVQVLDLHEVLGGLLVEGNGFEMLDCRLAEAEVLGLLG